ncbi:CHAT domain-containing protein [Suillus paluster]|uniref:CHAT domain-containing protein n=1 Tax=Suillus paluster TaxID=48578 RepID=UPI001B86A60E|nr:CHAT domain-containing protein [Suillus paluster]KAG1752556.1 CHAT domain-containing protein [Suillus paluster]
MLHRAPYAIMTREKPSSLWSRAVVSNAHKFSELSKCLSGARGSAVGTDRAEANLAAIEYRRLTKEWEAVVAEIRNLHGFSRFLLQPSYKDLQAAASHGPVIILIVSKYSCNALIVTTSGQSHHVPFPPVILADLEMFKIAFTKEIRNAGLMGPIESRKDLRRDLKLRRQSRIWLCPTAAFTSIPLHAAHPCRPKADHSGQEPCLENFYICSYTPTLPALIRSRQMMKTRATPSFVAIGQSRPGARQGMVLADVDIELDLVHKLVLSNFKFINLSGDDATRTGALRLDQPLTLLDIMENDPLHAEFAFLSACHTAVGDEETPDEVIHFAAGLQYSGFKSVIIDTLWAVNDAVAKHVVEAFYENMFKKEGVIDCTRAVSALNYMLRMP